MTTIITKNSSTAGAAPTSGDLVQGELAVNVTDKRLYTENGSGTVVELGTNPSVPVTFPDGSASAPSLTNDGDTNTGVYFPAADTVGITTGGTERVRVDSSGNVGVGTSSPLGKVGIQGPTQRMGFNVGTLASPNAGNLFYETDGTGWDFRIGKYQSGSFTAQMTLADSGNVGIGTSSPAGRLDVKGTANGTQAIFTNVSGRGLLVSTQSVAGTDDAGSVLNARGATSGTLIFQTDSTERARIDSSGNLLVGTTSATPTTGGIALNSAGYIFTSRGTTTSATQIGFNNANGLVGQVQTTGTSTAYLTSSDYRLKENIAPMTGALAVVQQLKPCTYTWKADGSNGQGFIAHELQEVVPECVGGEKDAVDEDGNPQYQGIDTSFLVATLTKAIQEQQALITTLTERITALEQA